MKFLVQDCQLGPVQQQNNMVTQHRPSEIQVEILWLSVLGSLVPTKGGRLWCFLTCALQLAPGLLAPSAQLEPPSREMARGTNGGEIDPQVRNRASCGQIDDQGQHSSSKRQQIFKEKSQNVSKIQRVWNFLFDSYLKGGIGLKTGLVYCWVVDFPRLVEHALQF